MWKGNHVWVLFPLFQVWLASSWLILTLHFCFLLMLTLSNFGVCWHFFRGKSGIKNKFISSDILNVNGAYIFIWKLKARYSKWVSRLFWLQTQSRPPPLLLLIVAKHNKKHKQPKTTHKTNPKECMQKLNKQWRSPNTCTVRKRGKKSMEKRETTCQFQIIQLQELTVVSLLADPRQSPLRLSVLWTLAKTISNFMQCRA